MNYTPRAEVDDWCPYALDMQRRAARLSRQLREGRWAGKAAIDGMRVVLKTYRELARTGQWRHEHGLPTPGDDEEGSPA